MTDLSHHTHIGVDIGGTHLRVVVVVDGAQLVQQRVRCRGQTPDEVANTLATLVEELDIDASMARVGVAIAGMIPTPYETIEVAPNLGWRNVPFVDTLTVRLGTPSVRLSNDIDAIAWAEHKSGAARDHSDVFVVCVGTGVGAAAIVDGRPLRGARGVACELGHVKLPGSDTPCGCGQRGCLEASFGGLALERRLAAALGGEPRPSDVDDKADDDDVIDAIWEDASQALGDAIANAAVVLNPSCIVLGGGLLRECPRLRARIAQRISRSLCDAAARDLDIVDASLGDFNGALGAALLSARQP